MIQLQMHISFLRVNIYPAVIVIVSMDTLQYILIHMLIQIGVLVHHDDGTSLWHFQIHVERQSRLESSINGLLSNASMQSFQKVQLSNNWIVYIRLVALLVCRCGNVKLSLWQTLQTRPANSLVTNHHLPLFDFINVCFEQM